jgi:hypothetical protein
MKRSQYTARLSILISIITVLLIVFSETPKITVSPLILSEEWTLRKNYQLWDIPVIDLLIISMEENLEIFSVRTEFDLWL